MTSPTTARTRSRARTLYAKCKASRSGVESTRRQLAHIAWAARTERDWGTYREVARLLKELRERSKDEGWKPTTPEAQRIRRETRRAAPVTLEREAEQRIEHDRRLAERQPDPAKAERNLLRWRAEAICQAVWGLMHGQRDWESIPTRPMTANVYMSDAQTTASVQTPQRLVIRVPAEPELGIEAHELRIYRAEFDALLESWGVPQEKQFQAARVRCGDSKAARQLYEAALLSLPRPDLVAAWAEYIGSPRLGAVFQLGPRRGEVRLAPRRDTGIRECAACLVELAEVMPLTQHADTES